MAKPFVFVGGPHDGRRHEHSFVQAVSDLMPPTWAESGMLVFLLLPSLEDCERIIRGEMRSPKFATSEVERSKPSPQSLFAYERVALPNGGFEFRHVEGNRIAQARAEASAPLSEEAQRLKTHFANLADEFIAEVRAAGIGSATEVFALAHCVNENEEPLPPYRIELSSTTSVTIPGDREAAKQYAEAMYLDTIVGNINSMVRGAPTGWVQEPGLPFKIQRRHFELLIEQP